MQRNVQRPRTSIFPECPRHRPHHLQTSDWARTHTNNYITDSICWRQKHRLSPYSPSRLNRPYFCWWPVAVVPDEQQTSRRAATGSAGPAEGATLIFKCQHCYRGPTQSGGWRPRLPLFAERGLEADGENCLENEAYLYSCQTPAVLHLGRLQQAAFVLKKNVIRRRFSRRRTLLVPHHDLDLVPQPTSPQGLMLRAAILSELLESRT